MKLGWIIYNGFNNSEKFTEHVTWFVKSFRQFDIELKPIKNSELSIVLSNDFSYSFSKPDFVLFWDKDTQLAKVLEALNIPLFNSSEAIDICDNKFLTHIELSKNNIPTPKTIVGPKTFPKNGYNDFSFVDKAIELLGLPLIIKECYGSFGFAVYLANNKESIINIINTIGTKPFIFQEFIKSSFGKDLRLNVVGDEVVAATKRINEKGDYRANVTNGGTMYPHTPSKEEIELAIKACKATKCDFAGVDLLFTPTGPIVCEVNSNAHLKNVYLTTNKDVTIDIARYINNRIYGGK